jgi:rfaE bifunctional protein nucleotidyltransferase chain/domain
MGVAGAVLVSDYGQGVAALPDLRACLGELSRPVVWDPHPRGPEPVPGITLAIPNRAEAGAGPRLEEAAARGRELRERWRVQAVAVTLGSDGAVLVQGPGVPTAIPAPRVVAVDVCGAGDRFAATCAAGLAEGRPLPVAVAGAVMAASAYVAGGAAQRRPAPAVGMDEALRLAGEVRARGGRVVATGGCFDLLHAGHVHCLRNARALGDCLVVLLNSDASVRRLKGPGRPVVGEQDRMAVLEALGCVDAVVTFDEDTPEAALRRLRPDLFAKGADYAVADLPEAPLLRGWGGEVVLVPFLSDHSTTRLLEVVGARAHGTA